MVAVFRKNRTWSNHAEVLTETDQPLVFTKIHCLSHQLQLLLHTAQPKTVKAGSFLSVPFIAADARFAQDTPIPFAISCKFSPISSK
ncbi:hypothetical protein [Mucilaginibacter flavus]|uniref:hypothetical protein n=1 Tax=Mucilaginibacter flavus TaxID=931504 RepID=UPI0025B57EBD|nr:hypothetical protein [Mucilaginibacter flavus]MDN3580321.1 hypothetical protein [Mucilaginibacter flavus]